MVDELRKFVPQRFVFATLFAAVALAIVGGGYGYYYTELQRISTDKYQELAAIGELKSVQIQRWRRERLADVSRPTQSPFFRSAMVRWYKSAFSSKERTTWLNRLRSERDAGFDDALILDITGKIILSATENPDPVSPVTRRALKHALTLDAAVLSDFYRCTRGRVHIDALSAVRDQKGTPVAVLLQRSSADEFLYPLIQTWPIPSETAESFLVQRDGNHVLFLNELRHRRNTALIQRFPLKRTDLPAVQAVLGKQGYFRGKDYRSMEVMADLRPVADSPWFLVAKVDTSELLAEARFRLIVVGILVFVLLVLAALVIAYMYRRQQTVVFRRLYEIERKRREESEEFRTVLYSIGDGVVTTDITGSVRRMNQVAEQLTGWSEDDARGKLLRDVFHIVNEDSRSIVENPVEAVIREGKIVGLANHTVLIAKDGTERPIDDSGAPIRDEHGVLQGVVLVFRDVSEYKHAQRALRISAERLQSIFRVAPIGIGTVHKRVFVEVNDRFCQMTGYSREELLGHDTRLIYASDEEYERVGRDNSQQLLVQGINTVETTWVTSSGTEIEIYLATTLLDSADISKGITFAALEVTEIKRAREDREALEAQLLQSKKMEAVGRLAGGVAHDFNNMLNVILGYAELALSKIEPGELIHEYLTEISCAARRSGDLTRQLLAFARRQTIQPQILDLNETIAGMLKLLIRLIGENITLHWKPAAYPTVVKMDPVQIDQILANLLVNSRDAIDGVGMITIETGTVSFDAAYCAAHSGFVPGDFVKLVVSDTGCGMSQESLSHLFEPFYTTKEQGRGTGLGLATVYGIVKQNQGFINVYSELGKGTAVRIYLPRHELGAAVTEHERDGNVPMGSETVLVVEDEASLLALAVQMLEDLGYRVLASEGPARALQLAESFDGVIDLLVTDVIMPEMSGRDLLERLLVQRPSLRCLYISGYTAEIIAHHGVLHEGICFLQKPFTSRELALAVRKALTEVKG